MSGRWGWAVPLSMLCHAAAGWLCLTPWNTAILATIPPPPIMVMMESPPAAAHPAITPTGANSAETKQPNAHKPVPKPAPSPTRRSTAAAPPMTTNTAPAENFPENGLGTDNPPAAPGHGETDGATLPGYDLGDAHTPSPDYPFSARRRGIQGRVVLRLEVDDQGRPTRIDLIDGSGDSALDQAALECVARWRLRPARLNGRAIPGSVTIPISFRLIPATL